MEATPPSSPKSDGQTWWSVGSNLLADLEAWHSVPFVALFCWRSRPEPSTRQDPTFWQCVSLVLYFPKMQTNVRYGAGLAMLERSLREGERHWHAWHVATGRCVCGTCIVTEGLNVCILLVTFTRVCRDAKLQQVTSGCADRPERNNTSPTNRADQATRAVARMQQLCPVSCGVIVPGLQRCTPVFFERATHCQHYFKVI